MGAWKVMSRRLPDLLPEGVELGYIGRPSRASPGEGYSGAHAREQERIVLTALTPGHSLTHGSQAVREARPGRLFVWVKRLSWIELAIFGGLIVFWLVPGFETETMVFGWAHGLGFIALCLVIWIACVRTRGPLHPACRDPHPGRAGRQRDRDRADRAQGLGSCRTPGRKEASRESAVDRR